MTAAGDLYVRRTLRFPRLLRPRSPTGGKMKHYYGDRHRSKVGPQDVFCHTEQGEKLLNPKLSQKLYNHSPDGFQWGYSGSGPAQLSLAILLDFTCDSERSLRLHQDFKRDKIAGLNDYFILTEREIQAWLEKHP